MVLSGLESADSIENKSCQRSADLGSFGIVWAVFLPRLRLANEAVQAYSAAPSGGLLRLAVRAKV
jgi:hypothetical protein